MLKVEENTIRGHRTGLRRENGGLHRALRHGNLRRLDVVLRVLYHNQYSCSNCNLIPFTYSRHRQRIGRGPSRC
jgi:hypothetical protein